MVVVVVVVLVLVIVVVVVNMVAEVGVVWVCVLSDTHVTHTHVRVRGSVIATSKHQ